MSQQRDEPLTEYRPGGYHPMKPGQIVAAPRGQYEVMRKLGWGEYSTVWMVKFQSSEKYAAMKVMKAEVTDLPELHESDYLRRVLTADPTHPGFQHNLHLLDDFRIEGPNGRHLCLVTELLGESLDAYAKRSPNGRLPITVVKNILRQVIRAMMYLHEKCNIIHTDIKSNNILFALPEGAIPTTLSTPPTAADLPTDLMLFPENATVKLIDLGVACWADRVEEHFTDLIQSPELRAPEVVVGAVWGMPADIWSLGCLVYELATGAFLIPNTVNEMSIPYLHAAFFGPYPRSLTEVGKYSSNYFNGDGSQLHPQDARIPLAGMIKRRYRGADAEGLIQFLEMILRLDPKERASLQTLLEHPWLSSN